VTVGGVPAKPIGTRSEPPARVSGLPRVA
jgi:hypothetical protein